MYAAQTVRKARTTGVFILSSHSNLGVAKGVAFSSDCPLISSDTQKCERLERITKVRLWEPDCRSVAFFCIHCDTTCLYSFIC